MALNTQHKRISKNRVSITYDVETNGALEKRELPFVVGVIGEFSGDKPDSHKEEVDFRNFTDIDQDNFDAVMATIGPQLNLKVANKLASTGDEGSEDDGEFAVNLSFASMKDFEPANVVQQIEPLRKLMAVRNQLRELLAHADRSRDLEALLKEVLQSTDALTGLSGELGIDANDLGASGDAGEGQD
ncbi:type VI secretion system contractile sheath small subunit [Endozoicomonas sp. GU-1]|uniref:type VI secretion system contractile sheath small subunit n=1 Tax=Endozoicomonas sp. GU-1 TaxID=3009078 RepID=UPI0022B39927|nr:type VI secretion system contractile sheath small subunit [Endozoicomonas sp. GU-1]WBA83883.1 type VI secretion system contractile sheath small subunit [Endozoicomonas sp. GU-1]WBA86862.1 type VI secretion system contractile sheath small subunit [Endozoicomonas sp. GU-1]